MEQRRRSNAAKFVEWAIYVYVAIMMIMPGTGNNVVQVMRLVFMFLFAIYFITERNGFISGYAKWAAAFLAYNAVMCFYAFSRDHAIDYTLTLAYVSIINICIVYYLYKNDIVENIMKVMIFATFLLLIRVAMTDGFSALVSAREERVLHGANGNTIGMYCALSVVFSAFLLKKEKRHKMVYRFAMIALLVFVVGSGSRKALLYIIFPLGAYYIMNSKSPVIVIRNIFIVGILIAAAGIAIMKVDVLYKLLGSRIESMISGWNGEDTDASTDIRMRLIEWGIEWFHERPWFGYGMSNFKALMERYGHTVYYAHNNYVELLVDCGLVGTVLYYLMYLILLIRGAILIKKNIGERNLNLILWGIMISLCVAEYGMVSYNSAIVQLVIAIVYYEFFDKLRPMRLIN